MKQQPWVTERCGNTANLSFLAQSTHVQGFRSFMLYSAGLEVLEIDLVRRTILRYSIQFACTCIRGVKGGGAPVQAFGF